MLLERPKPKMWATLSLQPFSLDDHRGFSGVSSFNDLDAGRLAGNHSHGMQQFRRRYPGARVSRSLYELSGPQNEKAQEGDWNPHWEGNIPRVFAWLSQKHPGDHWHSHLILGETPVSRLKTLTWGLEDHKYIAEDEKELSSKMCLSPYIAHAFTSSKETISVLTQPPQVRPHALPLFPLLSWVSRSTLTILCRIVSLCVFLTTLCTPSGWVRLHSPSTEPGQYRSGVSKLRPAGHIWPVPGYVNRIVLAYSYDHLFIFHLWLVLHNSRTDHLQQWPFAHKN